LFTYLDTYLQLRHPHGARVKAFKSCGDLQYEFTAASDCEIYTTINFTDEFRNVSLTIRVDDANVLVTEVGVAGWAWWASSTHTLSIEKQTWIQNRK